METLTEIIAWLLTLVFYLFVGFGLGSMASYIHLWMEERKENRKFLEEMAKTKK